MKFSIQALFAGTVFLASHSFMGEDCWSPMIIELPSEVNRAFSANGFLYFANPGALPQAWIESAL
jgi:hypothetical protein